MTSINMIKTAGICTFCVVHPAHADDQDHQQAYSAEYGG